MSESSGVISARTRVEFAHVTADVAGAPALGDPAIVPAEVTLEYEPSVDGSSVHVRVRGPYRDRPGWGEWPTGSPLVDWPGWLTELADAHDPAAQRPVGW